MTMPKIQEFSRSEAINMNRQKMENSVLLYVKDQDPIYHDDITFMTQETKKSNTETFMMLNRTNIAFANEEILVAILHKERMLRYKEEAIKWRETIEKIERKKERDRERERKSEKNFNNMLSNIFKLI